MVSSDCVDGGNWYCPGSGYVSGSDWGFSVLIVGLSLVFEGAQVWLIVFSQIFQHKVR